MFTDACFHTSDAKTAHGLVRGPSRYQLTALLDRHSAGRDAGEVLDGRRRGIPVFADLEAMLAALPRPDYLVLGVATHGGGLPAPMRATLLAALRHGISLVSGLHTFLGDDPELAAAARASGAQLVDVRRPRPAAERHFWTGAIRTVRAPRLAVLGTDCALGKRTTCHVVQAACAAEGLRAAIVHTGQTGWLQGIPHGFVLDSTPNDFVCGELEHAIVRCDLDLAPDLILLEGQSALRNPSGPCGAELILGGLARGVLLQHAPARRDYDGHPGFPIPPVADEIDLLHRYGTRVLGLCLNHEGLDATGRAAARTALERDTGLPAVYPLLEGVDRLLPALRQFAATGGHGSVPAPAPPPPQ
ncbi:MAG: DUF1611 domain-containing protein [Planctomycetes bacterium]|nr:DUF1611 domain-containing protein [Planctomycetota bacterium]